MDMENRYERELEEVLKKSIESERLEQHRKRKLEVELLDSMLIDEINFLTLKFKLPNSVLVKKTFYLDATFKDLRNFLDFYIFENSIKIVDDYCIVSNFPKKVFDIDKNSRLVREELEGKNILFYIYEP